jgi:hypothetical protein
MPAELPFEVGSRVVISYWHPRFPSNHVVRIIRASPNSFTASFEDGSSSCRYFRRDGRWRNQFGYQVDVSVAKEPDVCGQIPSTKGR